MGLMRNGFSAIGRLISVIALAGAFLVGLFGVVYLQLRGDEIKIPKVTGKNFNDGKDLLASNGLRIKKIATRYSNEPPNTILEQRPKDGTVAKTGLMISVIVSEKNPDGSEVPTDVKDDEEAIEEIEELPELKTDKAKKKTTSTKTKPESKSKDVVKKDSSKDKDKDGKSSTGDDKKTGDDKSSKDGGDNKKDDKKDNTSTPPKPSDNQKKDDKKPSTGGDTRPRTAPKDN